MTSRPLDDSHLDFWIYRPLGRAIARGLSSSPITPNQLTVIATAFGFLGAWLLSTGRPPAILLGLLSLWIWTVIDHADGSLARLRGTASEFGRHLDEWSDRAVFLAILGGVFLHLYSNLYFSDRVFGAFLMGSGILLTLALGIGLNERLASLGEGGMSEGWRPVFHGLMGRDLVFLMGIGYWICARSGPGALRWLFWTLSWTLQAVWAATVLVWKLSRPKKR